MDSFSGTGKTQTIIAIVSLLVMMGKSVLITSHTHSAVDNVLLRLLKENLSFLRLADPSRVPEEIRKYCECVLTIDCKTPEDLSQVYDTYVCSICSYVCLQFLYIFLFFVEYCWCDMFRIGSSASCSSYV